MVMKYKVVKNLKDTNFPTHSKFYKTSHEKADKVEKKSNPKEYASMKKVDAKLPKGTLAGKNFPSGKVEISSKVPKKDRPGVALHERTENKNIKRMEKKARK